MILAIDVLCTSLESRSLYLLAVKVQLALVIGPPLGSSQWQLLSLALRQGLSGAGGNELSLLSIIDTEGDRPPCVLA